MGAIASQHAPLRSYRRIAELGRGGMANVYLAAMRGPHAFTKLVVIKELKGELAQDVDFRTMFLDEARLAARLNHPNIVQTYEVGSEDDGQHFIVMEYLEGQPLHRLWSSVTRRQLSLAAQLYIVSNVLSGLDYAHGLADFDGTPLHVVHRDISPHNIFVSYSGEVKILDFGIAKASTSATKTEVGTLKGKLSYMAPEQAQGNPVDQRADVFSMGIVLWEAAVGRRLWKGMNDVTIMHNLMSGTIPRPLSVNGTIPPEIDRIIQRALAVDPDHRYGSAYEMQQDVDAAAASLDERFGRRELGALVQQTFVEEREAIKHAIDQQLRAATVLATAELPPVSLHTVPGGSPFPSIGSGAFKRPEPSMPSVGAGASAPFMGMGGGAPTGSFQRAPDGLTTGATPFHMNATWSTPPPAAAPVVTGAMQAPSRFEHRGLLMALVGGVGGLVVFIVALLALKWGRGARADGSPDDDVGEPNFGRPVATAVSGALPATAANGSGANGSGANDAPRTVRITVRPTPRDAAVSLDGNRLANDPGGVLVNRDDNAAHVVHVEAPGFAPRDVTVRFDRDRTVDVSLDRRAAPVSRGNVAPPQPPPAVKPPPSDGRPDLGY